MKKKEGKRSLTVEVWGRGDSSVGFPAPSAKIDLLCDEGDTYTIWHDKETRDNFRKDAANLFSEYFDEQIKHIGVMFSDECPDCGKRINLTTRKCTNEKCVSNYPNEY
jgi:hypothetical protein